MRQYIEDFKNITLTRQNGTALETFQSKLLVLHVNAIKINRMLHTSFHNSLIHCFPLLLPPSIFPSMRVFSNESVLHIRWPKYWSFSFIVSSSNEYSRLISFRVYIFDLLAVQGSLKGLLQHHSLKASFLWSQLSL